MSTIAPVTDGQVNLPAALLGPALDAVQMPELAPQIVADGFGASIYHALLHHGAVSTREFSRWLCLERKCKKVRAKDDCSRGVDISVPWAHTTATIYANLQIFN